ncbi:serine hydrolase, partial [Acinetobacter baumannii]
AFSLYTSAGDYGLFLATLLNDERTLKQITDSPVPVNPKLNLNWGLGWGLQRQADDTVIWHWGNNPGYRAFAMASSMRGDGFVIFTNSDAGLA